MEKGKKVSAVVLALLISAMVFSGWIGGKTEAASKVLELSFATTMNDSGVDKLLTQKFKEKVKELSKGTMDVKLYMGGQLGGEKEALELMKRGELDMGYNVVQASLYYPDLDATQVPFLFPDLESIERFMAGPIGQKIKDVLVEKGGMMWLGIHGYGSRATTSNRRFKNPQEMKGLKLRLPEIPIWIAVWKELGALPTPIPAPDIMMALKTGVVDAQENFLTNIAGRKMWEAQKYLILTNHVELVQNWLMSKKTWDKLTPEQRSVVQQAFKEAITYLKPLVKEENQRFIEEAKKNGMEVIVPNREAFVKKAAPAIEKVVKEKLAPGVYEEALRAIGEK